MIYQLSATKRINVGRRAKDELKQARVPAVVYGQGVETQLVSLPKTEFSRVYAAAGRSSLLDLSVEGAGAIKVVVKAVQVDPVSMNAIHVDLHQVRMDKEITAKIPLVFIGESAAVKVMAGTLIKSMDSLIVHCLPGDLPHEINVDLSKLATFEDSITVGTLDLPKGVRTEKDVHDTIATVAAPLTEDQLKALEASEVGDVTAVKSEVEEKRSAKEIAEAAEKEKKDAKK